MKKLSIENKKYSYVEVDNYLNTGYQSMITLFTSALLNYVLCSSDKNNDERINEFYFDKCCINK